MQTWGSHGGIRPFLALAEGLQAAGNEVHARTAYRIRNPFRRIAAERAGKPYARKGSP